jgi:hypothetical protein
VLLAFSEKKNRFLFSLSSNNKRADKVLEHEAKTITAHTGKNGRNPDRRKPAIGDLMVINQKAIVSYTENKEAAVHKKKKEKEKIPG